ncbi:hypothetical protein DVG80_18235 [Rhodococcus erythropolis]|nr:hypothetical protein DVG80_18235 [Rhodococcus erythropolis]
MWACSIEDVDAAGTRAIDDSKTKLEPDEQRSPGHAYVDYQHLSKAGMRTVKGLLLKAALRHKEIPTIDTPHVDEEPSPEVSATVDGPESPAE